MVVVEGAVYSSCTSERFQITDDVKSSKTFLTARSL